MDLSFDRFSAFIVNTAGAGTWLYCWLEIDRTRDFLELAIMLFSSHQAVVSSMAVCRS